MKLIVAFMISSLLTFNVSVDNSALAETYINSYKDVAIQEMHRTGIPASIKLAQGLLESDWGRSDLAKTANNHFGIKCGSRWTGGTFYKEDDDKDEKGRLIESCFRSFGSPLESYMAHSDFLSDPKKEYRYGFLFDYESTDYKSWAKGLKKSGYATDPKYPKKLIQIIENYKLYEFDQPVKTEELTFVMVKKEKDDIPERVALPKTRKKNATKKRENKRIKSHETSDKKASKSNANRMPSKYVSRLEYSIDAINRCRKVSAKGGETLEELSKAIGVSVDELISINEIYLTKDAILKEGVNVYLEKKKRSYKGGEEIHIVQEGETMESISQLYGIRIRSLYAKNKMPKGSKTITGVKLSLAKTTSERPRFELADSKRKHTFLFEEN